MFLSTFHPSRDPSTGWWCHSAAGDKDETCSGTFTFHSYIYDMTLSCSSYTLHYMVSELIYIMHVRALRCAALTPWWLGGQAASRFTQAAHMRPQQAPPPPPPPARAGAGALRHPVHARLNCAGPCTLFSLAEIPVLVGGAILPAPAVPASTSISSRLQRVQEHGSPTRAPVCWPAPRTPGEAAAEHGACADHRAVKP